MFTRFTFGLTKPFGAKSWSPPRSVQGDVMVRFVLMVAMVPYYVVFVTVCLHPLMTRNSDFTLLLRPAFFCEDNNVLCWMQWFRQPVMLRRPLRLVCTFWPPYSPPTVWVIIQLLANTSMFFWLAATTTAFFVLTSKPAYGPCVSLLLPSTLTLIL